MSRDREVDVKPSAAARARARDIAAQQRVDPSQSTPEEAPGARARRFHSVLASANRRRAGAAGSPPAPGPGGPPRVRTAAGMGRPGRFAGISEEQVAKRASHAGPGREAEEVARLDSGRAAGETLRVTETEESQTGAPEVSVGATRTETDRPQVIISTPAAMQNVPQDAQTSGDSQGRRLPAAALQQLVEFAELHREKDGRYEFHLGLDRERFKGAGIRISSYGRRRIGLNIEKSEVIGQESVDALVEALTERDIEIVEVVMN